MTSSVFDSLPFSPGSLIAGRYEVVKILGRGGMGMVVEVVDHALDNDTVALKLLFPHLVEDSVVFARFRNEVLVARKLAHPNIVRLYDFGAAGFGSYYLSMEFVDGVALGSKIYGPASQKLSLDEIVNILYEITLGVQHAHSRGVIHRDIKPDNILLSTTGEVKITDFGLARTLEVDKGFTNTGETVGTPYYMSPEQIRGDAPDKRSDIYSLGILAYELVSGRRPFNDECWFTLAAMHLNQPLPKLESKLNLPRWYEDFVQIATAKKPAERFQSMDDVVDLLEGELRRDRGIVRASKTRLAKRNHRLIPTGSLSPRAKMVGLCLATALVVAALGFFFPHSNFVP